MKPVTEYIDYQRARVYDAEDAWMFDTRGVGRVLTMPAARRALAQWAEWFECKVPTLERRDMMASGEYSCAKSTITVSTTMPLRQDILTHEFAHHLMRRYRTIPSHGGLFVERHLEVVGQAYGLRVQEKLNRWYAAFGVMRSRKQERKEGYIP